MRIDITTNRPILIAYNATRLGEVFADSYSVGILYA